MFDFDLFDDFVNVFEDGQMEVVIVVVFIEVVYCQIEVLCFVGFEFIVVDFKSFVVLWVLCGNLFGEYFIKSILIGINYIEVGEVVLVMEIGVSSSVINLVCGDCILMICNINVFVDDFIIVL